MINAIKKHDVHYLVHFTQCANLESIFQHGLLSVQDINNKNITSNVNDQYRYDGHTDAICASITFPNYKMFYSLQQNNKDAEWAILGIPANILTYKDCAFCVDNAARTEESSIPINNKKGVQAFNNLFENYPNKPDRQVLGILPGMTTNPQSEVLIFDKIEVNEITDVAFNSEETMKKYEKYIPNHVQAFVDNDFNSFFAPRVDYMYWSE